MAVVTAGSGSRDASALLAVIDAIQQAVATQRAFQAIVDVAGDRLREVFGTGDFSISWREPGADRSQLLYACEHGVRIPARHAFPDHAHDWHQLVYAISGVLTVTADGQTFAISPEQAAWLA